MMYQILCNTFKYKSMLEKVMYTSKRLICLGKCCLIWRRRGIFRERKRDCMSHGESQNGEDYLVSMRLLLLRLCITTFKRRLNLCMSTQKFSNHVLCALSSFLSTQRNLLKSIFTHTNTQTHIYIESDLQQNNKHTYTEFYLYRRQTYRHEYLEDRAFTSRFSSSKI